VGINKCTLHEVSVSQIADHFLGPETIKVKSRDSSVSIALGYGLDNLGSRVQFLLGAGNFSLCHCI
jgi:hypothetical protein